MLGGLSQRLHNVRTLAEAGIIRPARPDRLVRVARALHRFGPTPAAGYEGFGDLVGEAATRRKRFIGWHEQESQLDDPTLQSLIEAGDPDQVVPPQEKGRVVILTSGTTGTPKGASRSQPETLDPAAALLSKIPLRARERTMIAAPTFHSWCFGHL